MAIKVFWDKGEAAFPFGCPVCGEDLREYKPADDDHYEAWEFGCRCEIMKLSNGLSDVNEPCPEAMRIAMESIVFVTDEPRDGKPA
jgi:hypothetical protein